MPQREQSPANVTVRPADRPGDLGWVVMAHGEIYHREFGWNPETAKLRVLLVAPPARGLGVGSRLVEECLTFARGAGYRRVVLWTNDVLVSARRIYQAFGFNLTAQEAHHSFGHDLVGQTWTLELNDRTPIGA